MSELLVNTIKKADGTGSLTVPAESGTVVVKDGSNDVTLNNITATGVYLGGTGAANYLDDYEEGTWTPSVGGTATYDPANYGRYVKIGSVVTLQFRIKIATIGTGSSFRLSALPFTSENIGTVQSGHCSFYQGLAVSTIYLAFYVENNLTTCQFVGKSSSGTAVDNGIGVFGNGADILGQITYRTA